MGTVKLTISRGQRVEQIARSAGTPITGSDAIELNIDATRMRKGDALLMIGLLEQSLFVKGFASDSGGVPANALRNSSGGYVLNSSGGYVLGSA